MIGDSPAANRIPRSLLKIAKEPVKNIGLNHILYKRKPFIKVENI